MRAAGVAGVEHACQSRAGAGLTGPQGEPETRERVAPSVCSHRVRGGSTHSTLPEGARVEACSCGWPRLPRRLKSWGAGPAGRGGAYGPLGWEEQPSRASAFPPGPSRRTLSSTPVSVRAADPRVYPLDFPPPRSLPPLVPPTL